ncbi:uncharacterized protein LOC135338203 [Halichondria panicea]|uniref:uncharacterized protein LOC135338203 n=1 Tax=Halichondria panicea TaxID=6063 RepID=UPI00312B6551
MGDEVKRKPAKEQKKSPKNPPTKETTEEGYYDILLLGRAGRGKSSTADKLMVPVDLQIEKGDATQASTGPEKDKQPINPAPNFDKRKIEGASASNHGRLTEATDDGSDDHRVKIQYESLTGWVSSDDVEEHNKTDTRLKNIVFCRAITDQPYHEQIDKLRKDKDLAKVYESTKNSMLMTNDATMIQVLDTPGFYSPNRQGGATNEVDSNLAIVRRIVQIQTLAGLRIRRVLYFLPDCGPLTRSDRVLQGEISCMVKYFDKSIFSRMVLVGTVSVNFSKMEMEDEKKFSKDDLDESRELFYTTLEREFKERKEDYTNLPKPPIIFIAMTDTCEEIFVKIATAPVQNNDSLTVQFRSNQCCRCPAEIKSDKDGKEFACTRRISSGGDITVPYKESTCHPAMLPMYTARSVLTGIAKIMLFKWHFTEERCFNSECKLRIGSIGCKKIGTMHKEDGYEPIRVEHSDNVNDKVVKKKAKTTIQ